MSDLDSSQPEMNKNSSSQVETTPEEICGESSQLATSDLDSEKFPSESAFGRKTVKYIKEIQKSLNLAFLCLACTPGKKLLLLGPNCG